MFRMATRKTYLPEVLIRVNMQAVLTARFAQGEELAGVLSDIRITRGELARRVSLLPQSDQDEIDLAIGNVVQLYCDKVRANSCAGILDAVHAR